MMEMVKKAYVPDDYGKYLHRRRKNLRQKDMDVSACTKEFHKLCLKSKTMESKSVKVVRYLNGLRMSIQEECNLLGPNKVRKFYKLSLKVEDNIKRRQE